MGAAQVLVEEVARGIDAVNRTTLSRFMLMLGLQKVRVPLPVPGAGSLLSLVPLSPKITTEDRYAIDNGKALLYFIVKRVHSQGGSPVPMQMVRACLSWSCGASCLYVMGQPRRPNGERRRRRW